MRSIVSEPEPRRGEYGMIVLLQLQASHTLESANAADVISPGMSCCTRYARTSVNSSQHRHPAWTRLSESAAPPRTGVRVPACMCV